MTQTNDPPLVASVALIPDSDEKADLDAPSSQSGKLVVSQAPNITITSTTVVADQAERLALDPQEGDIAIQQDTTESFIFTGGANELANWQLVQFDAVGGIAGEDIAPRDIDGRNVTLSDLSVNGLLNGADLSGAVAGEALTSDGTGGLGFADVGGIEEVATFGDLPAIDPPQIAYVTNDGDYYQSSPQSDFFEIDTATFEKSVNSFVTQPHDIAFNDDGTKMYELDEQEIRQISLSTPFDIANRSSEKSINTQATSRGFDFSEDGTRLYEIAGGGDRKIFQSDLSTPFDIGTSSFSKSFDIPRFDAEGVSISKDGTRLYELDKADGFFQYALSTPFDIGTANLSKSISAEGQTPMGMAFDDNGTRLYEISRDDNKIFQSELSTPFDIGSQGVVKSISSVDDFPTGITLNNDGSRLYEVGRFPEKVYQSKLGSGGWVEF